MKWRHNERHSVSNRQPHYCLLNRLFRRRSKKTSKLHVTGLCAGNLPGTGEFPAQMASYTENVSIWWRHHVTDLLPGLGRLRVPVLWTVFYVFFHLFHCELFLFLMFIQYFTDYYTLRFNEPVYWFHLVHLSVCGQNRVRSVSSIIPIGSISYLPILSSNFRRCVVCNVCFKIQKFDILANSLNL